MSSYMSDVVRKYEQLQHKDIMEWDADTLVQCQIEMGLASKFIQYTSQIQKEYYETLKQVKKDAINNQIMSYHKIGDKLDDINFSKGKMAYQSISHEEITINNEKYLNIILKINQGENFDTIISDKDFQSNQVSKNAVLRIYKAMKPNRNAEKQAFILSPLDKTKLTYLYATSAPQLAKNIKEYFHNDNIDSHQIRNAVKKHYGVIDNLGVFFKGRLIRTAYLIDEKNRIKYTVPGKIQIIK